MIQTEKFTFNVFDENCYVVWDETRECVIIDPGCDRSDEFRELDDYIKGNRLTPRAILLTHAHIDHICGAGKLCDAYGIKAYMDPREKFTIDVTNATFVKWGMKMPDAFEAGYVSDGEEFLFGTSAARVLSTPGHSPGGICWWFERDNAIFTGDSLFKGCTGRTDLPGGDLDAMHASLRNTLMSLDGAVDIFPGHGPSSSIGYERQTNPFIFEEDFPENA